MKSGRSGFFPSETPRVGGQLTDHSLQLVLFQSVKSKSQAMHLPVSCSLNVPQMGQVI